MDKPKSEICDRCIVRRNRLRCMMCKHKTDEWAQTLSKDSIYVLGDKECFVERKDADGSKAKGTD